MHEIQAKKRYKYRMCVRPDSALLQPFPDPRTIDFTPSKQRSEYERFQNSLNCSTTIRFGDPKVLHIMWEDSFAIGLSAPMEVYFNRYLYSLSNVSSSEHIAPAISSECYLAKMLLMYGICLPLNG